MIRLTHDEATTVVKMQAAIAAMNDLVMHLNRRPGTVSVATRNRIAEADFMLNTAQDDIINDDPRGFSP